MSTSAGRVPGTESTENTHLFQEGILLPPVKLAERGRRNTALYDVIAANVRDPEATPATSRRRLPRAGAGPSGSLSSARSTAPRSFGRRSRTPRADVAAHRRGARLWPQDAVEAEGFLDDDGLTPGTLVRIAATVQVRGGELFVDLTGSARQGPGASTSPRRARTRASTCHALLLRERDPAERRPHAPHRRNRARGIGPAAPLPGRRERSSPDRAAPRGRALRGTREPPSRPAVAAAHVSFPAFIVQATDPRTCRLTFLTDILGGEAAPAEAVTATTGSTHTHRAARSSWSRLQSSSTRG